MTRHWHDVVHTVEPLTITPEIVAEFLEQRGRPRMASLVRTMAANARTHRDTEERLRKRILELDPPAPQIEPAADGGMRWTGD